MASSNDTLKVLTITIAYNNFEVIHKQISCFTTFKALENNIQQVIIDNSTSKFISNKISRYCRKQGIDYFKVSHNPYSGNNPSCSHGFAINWAVKNVLPNYKYSMVGFLDHDIFPVKDLSNLVMKLKNKKLIYGVINKRDKRWYLWPGFCFLNYQLITRYNLDFMPLSGLDTGGSNWDIIYSKMDKNDMLAAKCSTIYLSNDLKKNKQKSAYQVVDDSWIHVINASNWANVEMKNKNRQIDKLLDKIIKEDEIMPKATIKKSKANNKINIKIVEYSDIVKEPFIKGAIIRNDFPGFQEDYLVIHSIIRKYSPDVIMEIGTSSGTGTNIICNAMGIHKGLLSRYLNNKKVISIDVKPGTDPKIIYPKGEDGHPAKPGINCKFPFIQLFGSSIDFDFTPYYPIDAWFIDGKHDYEYCSKDTIQALKSRPKLIIWHDMQIKEVEKAVRDTMKGEDYAIHWVKNTRVAFAVKNN